MLWFLKIFCKGFLNSISAKKFLRDNMKNNFHRKTLKSHGGKKLRIQLSQNITLRLTEPHRVLQLGIPFSGPQESKWGFRTKKKYIGVNISFLQNLHTILIKDAKNMGKRKRKRKLFHRNIGLRNIHSPSTFHEPFSCLLEEWRNSIASCRSKANKF